VTFGDLIPPRRLDPIAILFLYTTAAGLILAAVLNPLALTPVLAPLSWVGAGGLLAIPWTTSSRQRAIASGVVAFVILARIVALLYVGLVTGATIYGAVFWAVVLVLARDQDQSFRQKLREGPDPGA
jgi:hypothetical protein